MKAFERRDDSTDAPSARLSFHIKPLEFYYDVLAIPWASSFDWQGLSDQAHSLEPDHRTLVRESIQVRAALSTVAGTSWLRLFPLPDLLAVLRRKLQGYWNYYGVRGNSKMLGKYQYEEHQLLYKWLNRRSQRRSMTWRQYCERWKTWDIPAARVVETFPSPILRQSPKPA